MYSFHAELINLGFFFRYFADCVFSIQTNFETNYTWEEMSLLDFFGGEFFYL